jgi:hypothetical protein
MADRGEMRIGAVEVKRYEECSVSPGPDNDLPVAHGAYEIDKVFMALPVGCHIQIRLYSGGMILGFHSCQEMPKQNMDPVQYMMRTSSFDEELWRTSSG